MGVRFYCSLNLQYLNKETKKRKKSHIEHQKISLFEKHLFSKEIVTIGDLISDTGIFIKGVKVLHANLSPIKHFKLMSVVDAILRDWRRIIRQSV